MGNECSHPSGCPIPAPDLNTVNINTIDFPVIGKRDVFVIPGSCGPAGSATLYGPECPAGWSKSESNEGCTFDSLKPGCELKCKGGASTCGTGAWTGHCAWHGYRTQCTRDSTTAPGASDAPGAIAPVPPENFGADEGEACSWTSDCQTHLVCQRGLCAVPDDGTSCRETSECPAGFVCLRGRCSEPVVGAQNTSRANSTAGGQQTGASTSTTNIRGDPLVVTREMRTESKSGVEWWVGLVIVGIIVVLLAAVVLYIRSRRSNETTSDDSPS